MQTKKRIQDQTGMGEGMGDGGSTNKVWNFFHASLWMSLICFIESRN